MLSSVDQGGGGNPKLKNSAEIQEIPCFSSHQKSCEMNFSDPSSDLNSTGDIIFGSSGTATSSSSSTSGGGLSGNRFFNMLMGGASGNVSANGDKSTNSITVVGASRGSSSGGTLNLADFPSLGGTTSEGDRSGSASVMMGGDADFAAALSRAAAVGSGSTGSSASAGRNAVNGWNTQFFKIASEDFPALPGAGSSSAASTISSAAVGASSSREGTTRSVSSGFGGMAGPSAGGLMNPSSLMGMSSVNNTASGKLSGFSGLAVEGLGGLGGGVSMGCAIGGSSLLGFAGQQQQHVPPSSPASRGLGGGVSSQQSHPPLQQLRVPGTVATPPLKVAVPGTSEGAAGGSGSNVLSGDYGLLGLLGIIRVSDADRNALALGSDLTLLELNLNSSEPLYRTFGGPWADSPATRDPVYQIPSCYYVQAPALKTGHLAKFQLETLFYIFYALPQDVLQAYAAQELYAREWRYHADLKLWFKSHSPVLSDGASVSTNASNTNGQQQQFIYFDIQSWERRLFNSGNNSMHQNITNGFLTDEEIRVKLPTS